MMQLSEGLYLQRRNYVTFLYPGDSLGTIKSNVMIKFLLADERQIMEAKSTAATFQNMTTVTDLILLFYF